MAVVDYLACPVSKLLESEPFKSWPVERSVDDDLDERVIDYVFEGHGLALQCDSEDRISVIFMCSNEHDRWDDSLFDIPFSLTRTEVLSRLGTPAKSGEKFRDPILGEYGAWDRFKIPQGAMHIQYQVDGLGIAQITLMRSDAIPNAE